MTEVGAVNADVVVGHIVNSMQNDNSTPWTDEGGVTWSIRDGGDDVIVLELSDEDDNTSTQRFRLVEE